MSYLNLTIEEKQILKVRLLKDLAFFTRFFFKETEGKKFLLNWHHKKIFTELENIYKRENDNLIINIPPRHSKTTIMIMFTAWAIAKNPKSLFLYISASDKLTNDNSRLVRQIITSKPFKELFNIEISIDTKAKNHWRTNANGGITTATINGQITGFGAGAIDDDDYFSGAIILDDPNKIKDFRTELEEVPNERFKDTIRSRRNGKKTPVILIQQRCFVNDLSGYLSRGKGALKFKKLVLPVINEKKEVLWSAKMDIDEITAIKEDPELNAIFDAQYLQKPSYKEGKMFNENELLYFTKEEGEKIKGLKISYIDDADGGDDFYCHIFGKESKGYIYITNVIFNKQRLTVNEDRSINLMNKLKVHYCRPEINRTGRYFSNNLKAKCLFTQISPKFNTVNKGARIYYQEKNIKKRFKFLIEQDRNNEYREFMKNLFSYSDVGKNKNDDAPDATAGLSDFCIKKHII